MSGLRPTAKLLLNPRFLSACWYSSTQTVCTKNYFTALFVALLGVYLLYAWTDFFFPTFFPPHTWFLLWARKKPQKKNSTFQCFCCNKCVICYLKIAIVAGSQSNIYAMSSSCEFYLVLTMPFIIISTCSYLSLLFISCSQTCHGQEVHMLLNKVFLQTALLLYVFGFPLFTELTQMHEKQNLRSWGLKKNIYSLMVLKIFPNLLCSLEFHWWFL